MYYIEKKLQIAGAHKLELNYQSKCSNLHGHNWNILIKCKSAELDNCGMVVDFSFIKKQIEEKLDHKYINDCVSFNPTAENIARWICEQIQNCYCVEVEESDGNKAIYTKEG